VKSTASRGSQWPRACWRVGSLLLLTNVDSLLKRRRILQDLTSAESSYRTVGGEGKVEVWPVHTEFPWQAVRNGRKGGGDSGWGWGLQMTLGAWRCWDPWTLHLQGESVMRCPFPPAFRPLHCEPQASAGWGGLLVPRTSLSAEGLGAEGRPRARREHEERRSERKEVLKCLQKTLEN
jgi:hypothetical protein